QYVFVFQAEDGIRARNVTGVQTCALPIWPRRTRRQRRAGSAGDRFVGSEGVHFAPQCRQVEHQALAARYRGQRITRGAERADIPGVSTALEDLDAARLWIDQPVPADSERRVVVHFLDTVATHVGWPRGNHL